MTIINFIKQTIVWFHQQRFEYHKKRLQFIAEYDEFLSENWKDLIE